MDAKTLMLRHVTSLVEATKEKSPMKKTNNTKTIYRESFKQALGCFVSPEDAAKGLRQFDQLNALCKDGGEEMASAVVLGTLGLHEAQAGVSDWIAGQLKKLGNSPKIETDSVKRFRELVKRINANIDKASIEIDGQTFSGFALKEAKIKNIREDISTYTATASQSYGDGKTCKQFGIEVILRDTR